MNRTYYVCKYTPIELLAAYGADCVNVNHMPTGFERAEQLAHPNLCGFGKSLLQSVLEDDIRELVLVDCCDTIRSIADILEADGRLDFLWQIDILHSTGGCSRERVAAQLIALGQAYGQYRGTTFDEAKFRAAFTARKSVREPYLAVLGARMGDELFAMVRDTMPLPVENATCVHNRNLPVAPPEGLSFEALMDWYAGELLGQIPCMRMTDQTGRRQLYNDPNLRGVIYHTVKFCDFYSFEYAQLRQNLQVPLLKVESDYTLQSSGQLMTRLQAFAESLEQMQLIGHEIGNSHACKENGWNSRGKAPDGTLEAGALLQSSHSNTMEQSMEKDQESKIGKMETGRQSYLDRDKNHRYFAGIDSGSTSTDVVILDQEANMVTDIILPTGAGAAVGAQRALARALQQAGLRRDEITMLVTTGYGRAAIPYGDKSITEITCHAKGAHFLDPQVRTVIDIGGQDSKVIRLDAEGNVENFAMNDKCAAGTGRFLEMMARTMEMSLEEMAHTGLAYREDITISSMCTVFAESEVVSLIAQNKARDDIVHGLNKAVAAKTLTLIKRVGGQEKYMMTGGVSKNAGLVQTLQEQLGAPLVVSDKAQVCGALGAALFAREMACG